MRLAKTPSLLVPLAFLLLLGLLAGCDQSGDSREQEQAEKAAGKAAEKAAGKKEPLQRKTAIGTVRAFQDDRGRLSLRPVSDTMGKKPLGFKVRRNARVTLGGKRAKLGDIEEGQQAQISYVVENGVNRAFVVHLFDEQPSREKEEKG